MNCAQSDFSGFIKQLLQDTDFTKLLQNCVAKIVANTIVEVKEHLSKRILETENRLENHDGILLTMQNSLDEKAQEVKALSKSVGEMKDHIDAMQNTLHDAEQHNRRNFIRLYGVPEAVGENTDRAVIQALNSNLPCSLSPDDIESSHRSGKPRVSGPGSGNKTSKPRPILIKLCSYKKKIEIMKVKRNLKRTGLSVHEDLTSRNYDVLMKTLAHPKVEAA